MKTKIFLSILIVTIIIASAFTVGTNLAASSNLDSPYPNLNVTVYQEFKTGTQSSAEVVATNGSSVLSGTTNSSGIVSFNMTGNPNGTYSLDAWYPARPHDSRSGHSSVNYQGGDVNADVVLGPNY